MNDSLLLPHILVVHGTYQITTTVLFCLVSSVCIWLADAVFLGRKFTLARMDPDDLSVFIVALGDLDDDETAAILCQPTQG